MNLVDGREYEAVIKEHLATYNRVTGIPCFVIDDCGEVVFFEGEYLQFCLKFKELTGDRCPCNQAHLYASRQSEKIGEPYVFFCPSGLVHWCAPIIVNGMFKNAFVAGPVQMDLPDDFSINEIIKAHNLNISSRGILHAYLKMVPLVDTKRVRYLSKMLYVMAKDIMAEESKILLERRKYYKEQAALCEEIQAIKDADYEEHISKYYPVQLEKELVSKVRIGDKKGAKTILNELLGHVLFHGGSNIEVTKSRVLELMIVLSRAAVEGGGNLEMIFGLNLTYLKEVSDINSVDELCHWIIKVLERFTDSIVGAGNSNNYHIIQKSITYINENSSKDITLEKAADFVYLSSSYFSRLFKKEMGINFIDYLNKVRVEESKKYLSNENLSISEIANIVGFTDQSYYTKVFRKIEGTSPGQYRKMI